jgi:hypothetical protein
MVVTMKINEAPTIVTTVIRIVAIQANSVRCNAARKNIKSKIRPWPGKYPYAASRRLPDGIKVL